ncbi:MAG: hypothetical protein JWR26_316 [Pedosphaera sp.]|nr:hypothetical protein [Pedosphaera sp.]
MRTKGKDSTQHSQQSQPRSQPYAQQQAQHHATAAGTELFDQAIKSYEQALRTGVRFQEDTARWWTNFLNQSSLTHEWQKQVNSVVSQAIPTAQRSMEESLRLIDQGSKTGLNLLKRAMDAPRTNVASDVQSQVQELWQSSLNVMQSNMQSITQSQAKVMESWTEFVRKGVATTTSAASNATSAASR